VARRHVTLELATEDFELQLERSFGLAPFTLRSKLQGLDTLLRRAKDAHAVVVSKVESNGDFRDLCNIADIIITSNIISSFHHSSSHFVAPSQEEERKQQQQYLRQCSNDLDVLYADAEQAHAKLRSLFAREWRVWKEVASVDGSSQTVLSVSVEGETEEWVDKVVDPGFPLSLPHSTLKFDRVHVDTECSETQSMVVAPNCPRQVCKHSVICGSFHFNKFAASTPLPFSAPSHSSIDIAMKNMR